MSYLIDPRKNWAMAEKQLADERDPRRTQILETLIAHSQAESKPDFEALMATVSPRAHYRSYAAPNAAENEANSPEGKDGVAAYYSAIVESGCHYIEHDVERMAVGQDLLTTEGTLRMAYPGAVLGAMGHEVPDATLHYLFEQRMLIVWAFDAEGLVLCEDSYSGGGLGFDGIAERPIAPDQIYRVAEQGL